MAKHLAFIHKYFLVFSFVSCHSVQAVSTELPSPVEEAVGFGLGLLKDQF